MTENHKEMGLELWREGARLEESVWVRGKKEEAGEGRGDTR